MKNWKQIFIIVVIIGAVWALIPTFRFYAKPEAERLGMTGQNRPRYVDKALKLGLDLQGGMYMVLEIDDSQLAEDAKKDALDRVLKIMRNRVDQFGVAEPVIQKQGDKRIIVQLPGLQDPSRAKTLLGQTALLEFRLVRETDEMRRAIQDLDRVLHGRPDQGRIGGHHGSRGSDAGRHNGGREDDPPRKRNRKRPLSTP